MAASFRLPPLRAGEKRDILLAATGEIVLEPGSAVLSSTAAGASAYQDESDSFPQGTLRMPLGDLQQYAGRVTVDVPFTVRPDGPQAAIVTGTLRLRGDIRNDSRVTILFTIGSDNRLSLTTTNAVIDTLRTSFRNSAPALRRALRAGQVLPYDPAAFPGEVSETVPVEEVLQGQRQ
jgi:hypothetical protein